MLRLSLAAQRNQIVMLAHSGLLRIAASSVAQMALPFGLPVS
jgi:hypothetical protein